MHDKTFNQCKSPPIDKMSLQEGGRIVEKVNLECLLVSRQVRPVFSDLTCLSIFRQRQNIRQVPARDVDIQENLLGDTP